MAVFDDDDDTQKLPKIGLSWHLSALVRRRLPVLAKKIGIRQGSKYTIVAPPIRVSISYYWYIIIVVLVVSGTKYAIYTRYACIAHMFGWSCSGMQDPGGSTKMPIENPDSCAMCRYRISPSDEAAGVMFVCA